MTTATTRKRKRTQSPTTATMVAFPGGSGWLSSSLSSSPPSPRSTSSRVSASPSPSTGKSHLSSTQKKPSSMKQLKESARKRALEYQQYLKDSRKTALTPKPSVSPSSSLLQKLPLQERRKMIRKMEEEAHKRVLIYRESLKKEREAKETLKKRHRDSGIRTRMHAAVLPKIESEEKEEGGCDESVVEVTTVEDRYEDQDKKAASMGSPLSQQEGSHHNSTEMVFDDDVIDTVTVPAFDIACLTEHESMQTVVEMVVEPHGGTTFAVVGCHDLILVTDDRPVMEHFEKQDNACSVYASVAQYCALGALGCIALLALAWLAGQQTKGMDGTATALTLKSIAYPGGTESTLYPWAFDDELIQFAAVVASNGTNIVRTL